MRSRTVETSQSIVRSRTVETVQPSVHRFKRSSSTETVRVSASLVRNKTSPVELFGGQGSIEELN